MINARVHFVLGAPFIIIGLVTVVLFIIVLVDMVRRPDWQWKQAGSNKAMWIVLEIALFILFGFLSIVSGIVYLVSARPKLLAAERAGPGDQRGYGYGYGYGYGGRWGGGPYEQPPGGWGAPPTDTYGSGGAPSDVHGQPPGAYGAPSPGDAPGASGTEGGESAGPPRYPGEPPAQAGPAGRAEPGTGAWPGVTGAPSAGAPATGGPATGAPATGGWPGATAQIPAAWQPDPSGRHELRFWDGTRWTEHVADAGQQSTDPLPQ